MSELSHSLDNLLASEQGRIAGSDLFDIGIECGSDIREINKILDRIEQKINSHIGKPCLIFKRPKIE